MTEQTTEKPTVVIDSYVRRRVGFDAQSIERMNRRAEQAQQDRKGRESVLSPAPEPAEPVAQHPATCELAAAGDLGEQVAELLGLPKIDGTLSRSMARVTEEDRELTERNQRAAVAARVAEAVAHAWTAAEKREKVPPTLTPVLHWHDHELLTAHNGISTAIRQGIEQRATDAAGDAVRSALDAIDELVVTEAGEALSHAVQAFERLKLAGVSVDTDARSIIDSDDDGAVSAARLWSAACARWERVQIVRQWVGAVVDRGFVVSKGHVVPAPPPRIPSGQFADTEAIKAAQDTAERRVQGSPFTSEAPRFVREGSAHTALSWWCGVDQGSRPAPSGVADLAQTQVTETQTDDDIEEVDAW
ncbi:hypothetical protein [Gordonia bronchialis]|uniref:hypothetical protein n=1 Tax=Gordonia bronchialis TaxID=2054 RepID=UPI00226E9C6B|nr:hypothetical protein [Gordonia bronchialis]